MLFRIGEPGRPAFQLRRGEEGLSVFDSDGVAPPLTESELLQNFRAGSIVLMRSRAEVNAKGLSLFAILGAESLPTRLRDAHVEIRPGPLMTRAQFKQVLAELE